jgi:hypothetical protein
MLRQAPEAADQQPDPAWMQTPEPVHELPEGCSEPQLFQDRRAQGGDQAAHF